MAGSPTPAVDRIRSVRLAASVLPAMAVLFGATAPSRRLPGVALRALGAATVLGGTLIAVLGAPGKSAPDPDPRHPAAPAPVEVPVGITILVPARNEAHVIGALLADLGRLRGPQPEVVVIDDGSDDATSAVALASIAKAGVNGRLVRRSRGGDGKARALASVSIAADPARFFVVLDADARVDPGFAESCTAMAVHSTIATARRRMVRPARGSRLERLLADLQDDEQSLDDVVQRARLALGGAAEFRGNGMLIRSDVLASLGGWPVDAVCEDLELSALLFRATGRGVARHPDLLVWEQPVIGIRALIAQRLRWAEGSIRRDLRLVYPTADGDRVRRRSLEPLVYAGQSLVPWIGVGLALRCGGAHGGTARRQLAGLLGAYGLGATAIAVTALATESREPAARAARRTIGAPVFAALWLAILPVAWLRVLRRPGTPRFEKTAHGPAGAFTEPEPARRAPT